jgi:low temperature requirement protein LtrA
MYARWIWASLAIVAMWGAALLISLFGPTLVVDSAAGDHVDMPAAGIIAVFFAFIATVVLAVVGFRGEAPRERRAEEERPVGDVSPTGA